MVYTLTQGAQGYNSRLHYSLYGGAEYITDKKRIALKEFLPLAAIPAVSIALLVAIINFHIPVLSPTEAGNGQNGTTIGAANPRAVLFAADRSSSTHSSTGNTARVASAPVTSSVPKAVSLPSTTSMPPMGMTSIGNDNGQGIVVGGMGSGGGPTATTPPATVTVPVPTPTPLPTPVPTPTTTPAPAPSPVPSASASASVSTPVGQASATATTQQPQAGVDVTVPATGTSVSAGLGL